jgi:hypothetical protein
MIGGDGAGKSLTKLSRDIYRLFTTTNPGELIGVDDGLPAVSKRKKKPAASSSAAAGVAGGT